MARFKVNFLIVLYFLFLGFNAAYTEPSINLETILTDSFKPGKPYVSKDVFTKETPMLFVLWRSEKLKEGQHIKAVWIAENTHNVAPNNYTIDQKGMVLSAGMRGKIFSSLPGNFWDGKFTLSKPNKGWPLGQYHVDLYVDDILIKAIPYTISDNNLKDSSPSN